MALLTVRRRGGEMFPAREIVIGQIEEQERQRRHRKMRRTGQFELRTTLPGDVDADRVEAHLSDGVLTITVPRAAATKPKHIEVSA
ncbi:Hsp20 family protein [Nonomuraea angiospora]|uniref:Hsp20/alpha crystallin family protein n=1 Tax=Nonomuraea angiospora TaxID=46172 RepID=UPI0033F2ECCA